MLAVQRNIGQSRESLRGAWKRCLEGDAAGLLTSRQAMSCPPAPPGFVEALHNILDPALVTASWRSLLECLTNRCICIGEPVEAEGLGGHGQDALPSWRI